VTVAERDADLKYLTPIPPGTPQTPILRTTYSSVEVFITDNPSYANYIVPKDTPSGKLYDVRGTLWAMGIDISDHKTRPFGGKKI
jgi:hypothetical protein